MNKIRILIQNRAILFAANYQQRPPIKSRNEKVGVNFE
jgi:hypothetical protein